MHKEENSVENRATTACIKWFASLNFKRKALSGSWAEKSTTRLKSDVSNCRRTTEAVKVSLGWKRSRNGKQREKNKEDR